MAYDKLVDSAQLDATFKGIADAIRANTGITEKISQDDMAEKIPGVYESGKADGIEQGKESEYDRFWDIFQNNGNRTDYTSAFGVCWTDELFKPKYDVVPVGQCNQMFAATSIKNLASCIAEAGIAFDMSNATNTNYMFNNATELEEVPNINLSKSKTISYLFNACKALKKVSLTLAENTVTSYTSVFAGCSSLEELTISGVIDIPLSFSSSSKLTKASIENIICALSTATSGVTLTLSRIAVTNAFGSTTAEEWTSLIGTKPNWTINLA